MSFDKMLRKMEDVFGYPLSVHADLCSALQARHDIPGLSPVERMRDFVEDSIHWKAEQQPGEQPGDDYWDDEIDEQSKMVARHFAGFIAFVRHPNDIVLHPEWGEASLLGTFFADLNPRVDGLQTPVYYFGASGSPPWWLFANPTQAVAFEKRLMELETTEDAARQALLRDIVDGYPRARLWFWRNLKPYGVKAGDEAPTFEDVGADRLLSAYKALIPIGRVMVERADGKTGVALTGAERAAALRVAEGDPGYPPNVLLRMLGLALAEDPGPAEAAASKVLDEAQGVPLTQRWARRVLDRAAPFGR